MEDSHRVKKGHNIVQLYHYIKFIGIAVFQQQQQRQHVFIPTRNKNIFIQIAYISITHTLELNLLTHLHHGQFKYFI